MTINPTLPPTVDEFRKVFPEFVDVSDEQVQFYLDTAMQWIDTFWYPIDAKLAVMYAAAHYLFLQDQATGGEITSGGSSGGGGGVTTDPEVGKIWVKSVRFRDRQVSYERVGQEFREASQRRVDRLRSRVLGVDALRHDVSVLPAAERRPRGGGVTWNTPSTSDACA